MEQKEIDNLKVGDEIKRNHSDIVYCIEHKSETGILVNIKKERSRFHVEYDFLDAYEVVQKLVEFTFYVNLYKDGSHGGTYPFEQLAKDHAEKKEILETRKFTTTVEI